MGNQFLELAVETAMEAGAILLSEFDRPAKISYKGEVDLVTQADRRSEEAIVTRLRRYFPNHAIVAEEGGGQEGDASYRWVVDPLDGTTNFAQDRKSTRLNSSHMSISYAVFCLKKK